MEQGILGRERIVLRAMEPEDALAVWEMESDSTQWLYNGMMAPFSMRNIKEYALSYEPDPYRAGQIRFIAQMSRPTGSWDVDVVGIVDLFDISAHDRTAWIGIYVRPGFRAHGYAVEMLGILEAYARRVLNLRSLAARVVDGNVASRKLFEAAEYDMRGVLRGWVEIDAGRKDVFYFQKNLVR